MYQLNPAGLLVHLQRRHNPTGPPVCSQRCTYNPTGLPLRSQGYTRTQTPNQNAPHNLSPRSWVLCFDTSYLTRDSTTQRVCSPGAGFNPSEFLSPCGLPVSCCLAESVVCSCPSACLCVHLHGLGGARVVFPHPGFLWEA